MTGTQTSGREHRSLEDFLVSGHEALLEIAALGPIDSDISLVCHHFLCPDDEKDDLWGADAACVRLSLPLFESLPFQMDVDGIGGCVGIEAWEKVYPSASWLNDRMPRMLEIAGISQMTYLGWSFEPRRGPDQASASQSKSLINRMIKSFKAKTD